MAYVNNYTPPRIEPISTVSSEPYDQNFNQPLPQSPFQSPKIRLEPFVPYTHAKAFHKTYSAHHESLEKYLPVSWATYEQFLTSLEYMLRRDSGTVLFAIIDRTKENDGANYEESIAGIIGFLHSSTLNLSVEIGPVVVFPPWQRTFVSSHAIGLLLTYALNLPHEGGLGLRRVAWTANPFNVGSVRAAERMGLKVEGV